VIEHVSFKDYNNNILKSNNHVHLNHLKKISYGFIKSVISIVIEPLYYALTFERIMKTSCFDLNSHKCLQNNESHQKLKQHMLI